MDRTQLQNAIANVKPGQTIKLKFNDDAKFGGINYVRVVVNTGMVEISRGDLMTIHAVAESQDWERPENKIVQAKVLAGFNVEMFAGRMYRELDGVEVLN